MTRKTISSIVMSALALTLVVGVVSFLGCGSDKTAEEAPAPAAETAAKAATKAPEAPEPAAKKQAGLDMGEKLAITQHFEEEAKAQINADNAAAELEKLAQEIEADK